MPRSVSSAALPTATRLPSTVPTHALAGFDCGNRPARRARGRAPRRRRRSRRRAGARCRARGWRRAAAARPRRMPPSGVDRDQLRLALGQGAGLVDDQRVDLFQQFERFGVLDQHAGARAAAGADHDRHRRRQAERARAGDDQHRDGVDAARSPSPAPGRRSPRRRTRRPRPATTAGTNQPRRYRRAAGSARASAAPRRPSRRSAPAACRCRPARRASQSCRCALTVRAGDLVAGRLLDRHRLAGDHRLVDRAAPFDDDAVDRHLLAGPHAQRGRRAAPASSGTSSSLPSVATRRARLRREVEQRADRARWSALRARSSSTWPSSTSVTMTAAASK